MQAVSEDHAKNMAAMTLAKPPEPLSLEDTTHRREKQKQFKCDWTYYETGRANTSGTFIKCNWLGRPGYV